MFDVLVVGAGPAGWALAGACARRGLDTALVDPAPWRPWPATYGAWADELPADLPATAVAARPGRTRVVATSAHWLTRGYTVLDNTGLRAALQHPGITVRAGRAVGVSHGPRGATLRLADGARLAAAVVADTSGAGAVSGRPPRSGRAEQTAVGVRLPLAEVAGLVGPDEAVVMDWRPAGGPGQTPTFLYALPLGGGQVLLEETALARRPGLPLAVLRARLAARLAAHGVRSATPVPVAERVRIPLDLPLPRPGRVVAFGAAAAMVHPATGYSVAAALRTAPAVAAAIAEGLPAGPDAACRAGRHAVWSPAARTVHGLRRAGLAVLLGLPPAALPRFFELFFALPEPLQRAYLCGREDVAGTARAMLGVFRAAPWRLRARLIPPGW